MSGKAEEEEPPLSAEEEAERQARVAQVSLFLSLLSLSLSLSLFPVFYPLFLERGRGGAATLSRGGRNDKHAAHRYLSFSPFISFLFFFYLLLSILVPFSWRERKKRRSRPLSAEEKGPVKHGSGIPLSMLFIYSFFPLLSLSLSLSLSFLFFFICDWDVSRLSR